VNVKVLGEVDAPGEDLLVDAKGMLVVKGGVAADWGPKWSVFTYKSGGFTYKSGVFTFKMGVFTYKMGTFKMGVFTYKMGVLHIKVGVLQIKVGVLQIKVFFFTRSRVRKKGFD
jgi:hypothetical protein